MSGVGFPVDFGAIFRLHDEEETLISVCKGGRKAMVEKSTAAGGGDVAYVFDGGRDFEEGFG